MTGEVLTVAQMGEADRLAVEAGVPSLTLMENAGNAVAAAVQATNPGGSVLVLCGPGNNGGDGFCAAAVLRERGHDVRVASLGSVESLKGDAGEMAKRWNAPIEAIANASFEKASVIVDALFGAGLARPLDGAAAEAVRRANASSVPIVAVDVPSGVHGDLGRAIEGRDGVAIRATRTVTFFRKKPARLLFPGRALCGGIIVAHIGIPDSVLEKIAPRTFENNPCLWRRDFPVPSREGHKYNRGHAVIVSGPIYATGAARMAARGALRAGAGLVSVASPLDAVAVNAAQLTAVMVKPFDGARGLSALLADKRLNAVGIGPGCGVSPNTADLVAAVLASGAAALIDADGLTSFAEDPNALFRQLHDGCVLTPHEGEFARIFPDLLDRAPSRLDAAREAARISGAVVILKGPDTVIASPDGRAAINANAPPWLATAGAGDVLTGIVTGLRAQHMNAFDAVCAAVWLHGDAAARHGIGLIAEDLPEMLAATLAALRG